MKKLLTCCLALALLFGVGCESEKSADKTDEQAKAEKTEKAEKSDEEKAEEEAAKKAEEEEKAEEEAAGQWVENELYGIKFRVPDNWKVSKTEEGVSATDADGTTTVLLAGSESTNLGEQMLNDLSADVNFKEVKLEKSGLDTFNGIPGMRGSGTAVMEKKDMDQEIQFLAYSFKLEDKTATMMIFSQAEMYEAKRDMINGIADTVTKMR
jgi:hypothetical protein